MKNPPWTRDERLQDYFPDKFNFIEVLSRVIAVNKVAIPPPSDHL